eukprot:gb/GECG01006485.1/.p1 GENE.gb/GECG01006485.1/~~gb/GECG01006485.1/.p1  ORF type:complete len:608 (+),score=142.93 gb/GECG01006485.1/:1-1824(+)
MSESASTEQDIHHNQYMEPSSSLGGHGASTNGDAFSHAEYHESGGHVGREDLDDEGGNDLAEEIESNIYHGISEQQEQPETTAAEALSSSMKMFNYKPKTQQQNNTDNAGTTATSPAEDTSGTRAADGTTCNDGDVGDDGIEGQKGVLKPPKKPLSAFFFFSSERRPIIQKEFPDLGIGKIQIKVGEEWANLDSETKAKYQTRAEKAKEEYQQKLKEYQEKIRKYPHLAPQKSSESSDSDSLTNSVFPLARVKKVVKADPDIHNVSKEAMLVSMKAAEYFLEDLFDTAMTAATRSGKKKVDAEVIGSCARKFPVYNFLADDFPADLDYSVFDKGTKEEDTPKTSQTKSVATNTAKVSSSSALTNFMSTKSATSSELWHQPLNAPELEPAPIARPSAENETASTEHSGTEAGKAEESDAIERTASKTQKGSGSTREKSKKPTKGKSNAPKVAPLGGFFTQVDPNERFAQHTKALGELESARQEEERKKEEERQKEEREEVVELDQDEENVPQADDEGLDSDENEGEAVSLDALREKHGKKRKNTKRKKQPKKDGTAKKKLRTKKTKASTQGKASHTPTQAASTEDKAGENDTTADKNVEDGAMFFPSM